MPTTRRVPPHERDRVEIARLNREIEHLRMMPFLQRFQARLGELLALHLITSDPATWTPAQYAIWQRLADETPTVADYMRQVYFGGKAPKNPAAT